MAKQHLSSGSTTAALKTVHQCEKLTECLEHKGKCVCIVFCSEGDDVFVSFTLQDL